MWRLTNTYNYLENFSAWGKYVAKETKPRKGNEYFSTLCTAYPQPRTHQSMRNELSVTFVSRYARRRLWTFMSSVVIFIWHSPPLERLEKSKLKSTVLNFVNIHITVFEFRRETDMTQLKSAIVQVFNSQWAKTRCKKHIIWPVLVY